MIRRPPRSTLFPYTTLFRSVIPRVLLENEVTFFSLVGSVGSGKSNFLAAMTWELRQKLAKQFAITFADGDKEARSEEHTSELQSRQYLVCRLLLEKKKCKFSCRSNQDRMSICLNYSHPKIPHARYCSENYIRLQILQLY